MKHILSLFIVIFPLLISAQESIVIGHKEKLYSETNSAKSELDELLSVQRNIDKFLGIEHEQENEQKKKRSGELE